MSEEDYDMIFKVVLIGDSGVGKTNLLSRYLKNEFSFDSKTTVGVEFGAKRMEIDGVKIKAQIWDTAGQERFRSITNAYYKGAKGALLVFDVTRRETFDSINKWVPELKQSGDKDVTIILVGNKSDLVQERQVSTEEGNKKAELYGLGYIETSAYKSTNVEEAFRKMIEGMFNYNISEVFEKFHKQLDEADEDDLDVGNGNGILIDNNPKKDEKKKECCLS